MTVIAIGVFLLLIPVVVVGIVLAVKETDDSD